MATEEAGMEFAAVNMEESMSCEIGKEGILFRKDQVQVGKSGITNVSTGVALIMSPDDLIVHEQVGQGASASVQKAVHKLTGQVLALKSISIYDRNKRHQVLNDIKSLENSQCPYLVQFYGGYYDEGHVTIALEYMDGGSLKNVINQIKNNPQATLTEEVLANITFQILQGLAYLHKCRHQIHRDIKPDNILINSDGFVKLTDFGISKELESSLGFCDTFLGTATYMSPERVEGSSYSYSSDIWSLGLVLYELATGFYPYPRSSVYIEMIDNILNKPEPTLPEDAPYSTEFKEFLQFCLQKKPENRLSAADLLQHSFLQKHSESLTDTGLVRERLHTTFQVVLISPMKEKESVPSTWICPVIGMYVCDARGRVYPRDFEVPVTSETVHQDPENDANLFTTISLTLQEMGFGHLHA